MKKLLWILLISVLASCESSELAEEKLIKKIEKALVQDLDVDDSNLYERVAYKISDTTYYEKGRQNIIRNWTERAKKYQEYIECGRDYFVSLRDKALRKADSVKALGPREDYFVVAKLRYRLTDRPEVILEAIYKVDLNGRNAISEILALRK